MKTAEFMKWFRENLVRGEKNEVTKRINKMKGDFE